MAASLSTITGKDGGGTLIVGGVQALDLSGAGTGPWSFANIIVDGTSGTNRAAVDSSNRLSVLAAQPTAANFNATVVGTGTFAVQAAQTGTWTVQPGNTANTTPWLFSPSTGGNTAAVKAASTAPAATDPALVVSLSQNGTTKGAGAADATTTRVTIDSGQIGQLGQAVSASSVPVVVASDQSAIAIKSGATGAAVPAGALYTAGNASTALASAATAGNLTGAMFDKFGRPVVLPVTIRDLMGTQTTTLSATTSETTIVTAGASGVFNDLVALIVSNTSASTNTRIDFRDATSGTIIFSLESIGGAPPVGIPFMGAPIPQTTAANNWTAQCATSTTDIRVLAVFAKNK